jgi:uncharacterized protein (TIGR03066 family)
MVRFACCLCGVLLTCLGSDQARADAKETEALLLGKWEMVSDPGKAVNSNVEFTKDGTFTLTAGKGFTIKGKFRVLDGKTIEVELPKGKDPKEVEASKATIEVTRDALTITAQGGKKVTRYKRSKE